LCRMCARDTNQLIPRMPNDAWDKTEKPKNPVVRRELRSYGYSYSLLNGELRSYQEFPNHILVL